MVDQRPGSVNFCVLGRKETAAELGKAGTSSDITIHDKKGRDAVRTWVVANGFPEKIQPLFQAINMSEHVIFHADALDRFAGEQIIALDILDRRSGILCHTYDVDEGRLNSMIKGTAVEGYARVEASGLQAAVGAIRPPAAPEQSDASKPPEVVIDHSFDVRGVGTVILGRVASGTVRQYDTLSLYPSGPDTLVKSIQMHDDPVGAASYPARVGLAVKGPRPDDIQRGDILACPESKTLKSGTDVTVRYKPNPFYSAGMSENQGCIVSVGLQARSATITSIGEEGVEGSGTYALSLRFAKPVAYHARDTAVVLRPEAAPVRIAGSGSIIPT